ncbi:hypothetical protein L9F63_009555 [Diploptera punctata]|uniref:Uncharacterized protein n=1 Tax=Diploptera punctata TaxID=6984 RepID=A0AAD8ER35_DIPPU|nr:hypothetical protein L9F63_009555 [Diploptera punctata]
MCGPGKSVSVADFPPDPDQTGPSTSVAGTSTDNDNSTGTRKQSVEVPGKRKIKNSIQNHHQKIRTILCKTVTQISHYPILLQMPNFQKNLTD